MQWPSTPGRQRSLTLHLFSGSSVLPAGFLSLGEGDKDIPFVAEFSSHFHQHLDQSLSVLDLVLLRRVVQSPHVVMWSCAFNVLGRPPDPYSLAGKCTNRSVYSEGVVRLGHVNTVWLAVPCSLKSSVTCGPVRLQFSVFSNLCMCNVHCRLHLIFLTESWPRFGGGEIKLQTKEKLTCFHLPKVTQLQSTEVEGPALELSVSGEGGFCDDSGSVESDTPSSVLYGTLWASALLLDARCSSDHTKACVCTHMQRTIWLCCIGPSMHLQT